MKHSETMKRHIYIITLLAAQLLVNACGDKQPAAEEEHTDHHENGDRITLTDYQVKTLNLKTGPIPRKVLSGFVKANGRLEVPPQHEANVTAILGGNVHSIKVIEGDPVEKGQVLAYIMHPSLIQLQTDYVKASSQLTFLEKELKRQKRLYDENVGSGQTYEKTQADYMSLKGEVKGYEAQIKQLNLNPNAIIKGKTYEYIPIVSPIDGFVEKVPIKIGQYASAQTSLFMLVNTEHIHADLMVYEKDIAKISEGQTIQFSVVSNPEELLTASIYSVGKQFEEKPKAIHVHAEIKNRKDFLVPGMYINGHILTQSDSVMAVQQEALYEDNGQYYIFGIEEDTSGKTFSPIPVKTGTEHDGWVAITPLYEEDLQRKIALDNAYYLVSEMKKSQASHSH